MRLVVGITGATGFVYAVELLKALQKAKVEVHLIISQWAQKTLAVETGYDLKAVRLMADYFYEESDMGAVVASGSFKHQGMVIIPCSMKTLSAVAHGYSSNLIARAADVTLKESRKLILVPRETPLTQVHLENMLKLANMGVKIAPPMPAFYYRPQTIDDLVRHFIGRIMDLLEIEYDYKGRWEGL